MDEEGYFYIVDRKKDLIIVGGYNVYPREIDEVLHTHPKIREAVTVGVNHRSRGETVKAYIVPEEGANLTVPEVVAFCRQKLASFKVPRLIEFREELPKTMVGKVLRRILREEELHKSDTEQDKEQLVPGRNLEGRGFCSGGWNRRKGSKNAGRTREDGRKRMRLLLQRVREGKVTIEGQNVASIGKGLVVLVGFGPEDTIDLRGGKLWNTLIEKMVGLRIFPDDEGKMNRGIEEAGGEIILVSQFTLYADSRKGRAPLVPPVGASGRGGTIVSAFCGRCAIQAAGTSPAGCVRCGHGRFPHKLGAGNALVGLGGFLADKRM